MGSSDDASEAANGPTSNAPTPPGSQQILIIEDDADSALVLEMVLEELGYQVDIAQDGVSGIAKARQTKPGIIISDIGLTKQMDGYTVARTIRADADLSATYLVATSGYGQPEDKQRAKSAGFDAHFTKPIDLARFQAWIVQKMPTDP